MDTILDYIILKKGFGLGSGALISTNQYFFILKVYMFTKQYTDPHIWVYAKYQNW